MILVLWSGSADRRPREAAERQTTPQIEGLLREHKLAIELKNRFPKDIIRYPDSAKYSDLTNSSLLKMELRSVRSEAAL